MQKIRPGGIYRDDWDLPLVSQITIFLENCKHSLNGKDFAQVRVLWKLHCQEKLKFSPNKFWNCSPGLEDWPGRVMKNVLNKQGGVVISNFDMKISPFWFSGPLLNFHDVGYPIIDSKLSQGIVEFQSFLNPTSCSKFKGHMYSKSSKVHNWEKIKR